MKGFLNAILLTQLVALVLLGLLLYPQTGRYRQLIRGVMAFIFIVYLPGYRVSYMFFAGTYDMTTFERFIMSFAISLALITFTAFYLHYFGILLYPIHIYTISLIIMLIASVYILYTERIKKDTE